MPNIKLPSLSDITEDDNGVLRMPFNPIDYGEHNSVERQCYICDQPFPQGEMKELGATLNNDKAYVDDKSLHGCSIFFCRKCWFESEFSDAGNWIG